MTVKRVDWVQIPPVTIKERSMKPFIDNQRGATARHKAHRSAKPEPYTWRGEARLAITAFLIVGVLLLLSSCASPYNHPGTPREPDPAYEGWPEEG